MAFLLLFEVLWPHFWSGNKLQSAHVDFHVSKMFSIPLYGISNILWNVVFLN